MIAPLARIARVIAVLAASWFAGSALCLMKGDAGGLLDNLGNLSSPYLIAAVLAGLTSRRYWSGALLGIGATEAMLAGFYWAYAALLGHEVSANTLMFWWLLGLASGTVGGLAGRAAVGRPALRYVIPAALIFEPLALQAQIITSRFGYGYAEVTTGDLVAYAIEVTIGVAVLLVVRRGVLRARRRQRAARPS